MVDPKKNFVQVTAATDEFENVWLRYVFLK